MANIGPNSNDPTIQMGAKTPFTTGLDYEEKGIELFNLLEFEKSIPYFHQSILLFNKANKRERMAYVYERLADCCYSLNQYIDGLQYSDFAINIYENLGLLTEAANASTLAGKFALKCNDSKLTSSYIENAIRLSDLIITSNYNPKFNGKDLIYLIQQKQSLNVDTPLNYPEFPLKSYWNDQFFYCLSEYLHLTSTIKFYYRKQYISFQPNFDSWSTTSNFTCYSSNSIPSIFHKPKQVIFHFYNDENDNISSTASLRNIALHQLNKNEYNRKRNHNVLIFYSKYWDKSIYDQEESQFRLFYDGLNLHSNDWSIILIEKKNEQNDNEIKIIYDGNDDFIKRSFLILSEKSTFPKIPLLIALYPVVKSEFLRILEKKFINILRMCKHESPFKPSELQEKIGIDHKFFLKYINVLDKSNRSDMKIDKRFLFIKEIYSEIE